MSLVICDLTNVSSEATVDIRFTSRRGSSQLMLRCRLKLSAIFIMATCWAVSSQAPRFEDFSASVSERASKVSPRITTPFQRQFRTQIIQQSWLLPNFAGHFRIAEWGCGSSCVQIAVIDLDTGHVWDGPFSTLSYAVPYRYEGGDTELDYRRGSRLLIARGCRRISTVVRITMSGGKTPFASFDLCRACRSALNTDNSLASSSTLAKAAWQTLLTLADGQQEFRRTPM